LDLAAAIAPAAAAAADSGVGSDARVDAERTLARLALLGGRPSANRPSPSASSCESSRLEDGGERRLRAEAPPLRRLIRAALR